MFTAYHAKYYAHALTQRHRGTSVDRLSQSMFDASVDLNPHQIEAALFALQNPLQEGVLLADEVGLGKTIEAALVLCQLWAERKRRQLIISPASLRQQWAREIVEKFAMPTLVLDSATLKQHQAGDTLDTLEHLAGKYVLIMSYAFARRLHMELMSIPWDIVVMDEAHKVRNAHRASNITGQKLLEALAGRKKLLLSATPLQNSLLELYGLGLFLDEHLFGDRLSFTQQFMHSTGDLDALQERIQHYVHRTLRKDVLEYIRYTKRQTITQPFEPTTEEQALYKRINAFLLREDSFALPQQQRHLVSLLIRKLLASSAHAVIGTLQGIRERLQTAYDAHELSLPDIPTDAWIEDDDLVADYTSDEFFDEEDTRLSDHPFASEDASAPSKDQPPLPKTPQEQRAQLKDEIEELDAIIEQARALTHDSKAAALQNALAMGFERMRDLGARQKAIIFTESRRTQEHLLRLLEENGYRGKTVGFSGSNTSPQATEIYNAWKREHEHTDHFTGSRQIDQRTALIEHFKKDDGTGADIMVATEAAAEGVNLQFCSLVINYDLPWNPQRIEQRIGRCHRYGQKYDVVVINFLNNRNLADRRVLELLTEKFQLFDGVFGASDEVLGRIESGIDFEKRIAQIYDTCRQAEEIDDAFNTLQTELEDAIQERMEDAHAKILESFDEHVHDRLKLRLDEANERLDILSRWFWGITRYALHEHAVFDADAFAFTLLNSPLPNVPTGRYQFIRGALQPELHAHAYRLNHPLGEWVVEQALNAPTPIKTLTFNYAKYPQRISDVARLQGTSGWLSVSLVQIESYDTTEALILSAITDDGQTLDQQACENLLRVESKGKPSIAYEPPPPALAETQELRINAMIHTSTETNRQLFEQERDKLERWADDKILSADRDLEHTKNRIRQLKRDARNTQSLEEQRAIQLEIAEQERKKHRQRRSIFDVEDEIEERRDNLIDRLEQRMRERTATNHLFDLRWHVV